MRLLRNEGHGAFYQSLSDLMFATLVLFIVLVMSMAVQLSATRAEAAAPSDGGGTGRFTGGAGATYCFLGYFPVQDHGQTKTWVVWVPQTVSHDWDLAFDGTKINSMGEWCELIQKDGLTAMPVEELLKMEKDVGVQVMYNAVTRWDFGFKTHLIRALMSTNLKEFNATTARTLGEWIGGADVRGTEHILDRLQSAEREFNLWSFGVIDPQMRHSKNWTDVTNEGDGEVYRRMLASGRSRAEPPFLRFRALSDHTFQIGQARVTAATFRGMLRSIVPGQGFYLEHVDARSGKPCPPPAWVVKEVLEAVGYAHQIK